MRLEFGKSLSGILTVEITSAAPEKTLDAIILKKIPIFHVVPRNELTYRFRIRRRDYENLTNILRKRGDSFQILQKRGLYWAGRTLCRRPILLATFFLLLFSSFYLPSRIFFVTVEGNTTIPDRLILSAAEDCGIGFAASRKMVRSEKVKNALLYTVPQLQWAGVNTSGCTAVISVRERVNPEASEEKAIVSNLIADRDGYILSATVTSGTAHFLPGEAVTKGQLLVSGYTDCGICIRASRAEGEIHAETIRSLKAVMPDSYTYPAAVEEGIRQISLLIGKKRINLWKGSSIFDTGCGRMYEEYYVSLPGGFRLPVAVCVDRYQNYELQNEILPESDAQNQLQQFSERYLMQQMTAGQILQKQQTLSYLNGVYRLEGTYTCAEMIGKEQREQIGVINGKRD